MNSGFDMRQAAWVVQDLVSTINQHRDWLSEVDGAVSYTHLTLPTKA